jgi:uncharacterized protein YcfL
MKDARAEPFIPRIPALAGVLAALLLSACASAPPEPTLAERLEQPLVIQGERLPELIEVAAVEPLREDGRLTVQYNLYNTTDKPFIVSYRFRWFDARQRLIDEAPLRRIEVPARDFAFLVEDIADPDDRVAAHQVVLTLVPEERRRQPFILD